MPTETEQPSRVALITGASAGFGRAVAATLAINDWAIIIDARGEEALKATARELGQSARVTAVTGDVTDPDHRRALQDAVDGYGRLDLLINNASDLGPSPLPPLRDLTREKLERIYAVDVVAPLALIQLALPWLEATNGTIVNISSDAAVEAYAGWGGYGSAKAALDRISAVLAEEQPELRVYAFDPGDMRTAMHQQAYPGEDISDRPEPESVVPSLLRLLDERPNSGRYRSADLPATQGALT
jgi:NAD(P)-dependent dehydrogenase (short-subunit alcohol dehydrogenase family)